MPAYLLPLDQGKKIVLEKAIVFIGRHPECDVLLTQSRKISRKHCCIAQVNDTVVIRDLGSMNGIHVNGTRVEREVRLNVDDEVMIGDCRYVFKAGAAKNGESASQKSLEKSASPATPASKGRPASRPVATPLPEDDVDFPIRKSGRKKSRPKPIDEQSTPEAVPLVVPRKSKKRNDQLEELNEDDLAVVDELDVVENDDEDSFQELELVRPKKKLTPLPSPIRIEPKVDKLELFDDEDDDDDDDAVMLEKDDEFEDSDSQVELIPE